MKSVYLFVISISPAAAVHDQKFSHDQKLIVLKNLKSLINKYFEAHSASIWIDFGYFITI